MKKILTLTMFSLLFVLASCSGMGGYSSEAYVYPNMANIDDQTGESYSEIIENEFISTEDNPVSTFSTDVDTASYSNIRRMINDRDYIDKDAVRIEEMINYFDYDLMGPQGDEPIHVTSELSVAPWNEEHQLLMVGLKAPEVVVEESEGLNLVFLIDTSGSMRNGDKLPLLKQAFTLLVEQLQPGDSISLVTYAGSTKVVLEGADNTDDGEIYDALDSLSAYGSTAGGSGIRLAYEVAQRHFIEGGNNRILLATDGDFNVGISNPDDLEELISTNRDSGIYISVLGFGTGNIKDDNMEVIADNGNGAYFYIDSYKEAEKVFKYELNASMYMVCKDVKLQIEFNPMNVKGYRLIGYENRVLDYEDFNDDEKDAGDMGSGDAVIAFYEIIPAGSEEVIRDITFDNLPETLRYDGENLSDELMNLDIRYKDPESDASELLSHQVMMTSFSETQSETFRFASSVVEFGLILRDSRYKGNANILDVIERIESSLGDDDLGYRLEFYELVRTYYNYYD